MSVLFSRIAQLSEQYGESTLPILIARKYNDGVIIENVCNVTQKREGVNPKIHIFLREALKKKHY